MGKPKPMKLMPRSKSSDATAPDARTIAETVEMLRCLKAAGLVEERNGMWRATLNAPHEL